MIDFQSLNEIARRVTEGEYHLYLSMFRGSHSVAETCRVSLEKGSTYGKFHMKVEGLGATPSEAFEAALRQFPPAPLDGVSQWDTQRIAGPIIDGEFNETT